MRFIVPALLVCSTALTGHALAQGMVYEVRGTQASPIGIAAAAGDMTSDGIPDLLVASGKSVLLFSGKDGALVRTIATLDAHVTALAGGRDVDGDGVPDVVAAMQSLSRVELRSGKSGLLMRQWSSVDLALTTWVGFLDDIDADGRPDVLVGTVGVWTAPTWQRLGWLVAYSSLTGSERARFLPPDASTGIVSISVGGDLDGDGRQDVAVGLANRYRRYDRLYWYDYYYPVAIAWTPANLANRTLLQPPSSLSTGPGYQVAVIGDVDNDRCSEVIACEGAQASLVSGKNAQLIHTSYGVGPASTPFAVGDLDADGTGDYALATHAAATVLIFSGKTGTTLWTQRGPGSFGWNVIVLGDLDADRIPEIAIHSPQSGYGSIGVFTYRLTSWKAGFATLLEPTGKPNQAPSLMAGTGSPVVGGQLAFDITAVGYDVAVVLMGLGFQGGQVAPIPGNPLLLYLDERFVLPVTLPLALIGGKGLLSLPIPQAHEFYGVDLGLQAALFALGPPKSFGATNLLVAKLGFAGPLGASLYRLDLALRAAPGDNYKNALGQPARLMQNHGPATFLTLLGSKAAGGPLELRTQPGTPPIGGGLLLGTIGNAAGAFETRVQVPSGQTAPVGVYLLNRDSVQVDAKVLYMRIE